MSNYEIISKEPVSNAEVFAEIEKKAQVEDAELTYREEKTQEYLKKFPLLSVEDFKTAILSIQECDIPRLDIAEIIKIIEIMPKNGTELRAIVSHSGIVLVDENVTKVLDVLKQFE